MTLLKPELWFLRMQGEWGDWGQERPRGGTTSLNSAPGSSPTWGLRAVHYRYSTSHLCAFLALFSVWFSQYFAFSKKGKTDGTKAEQY